jgi:hypothetical protein
MNLVFPRTHVLFSIYNFQSQFTLWVNEHTHFELGFPVEIVRQTRCVFFVVHDNLIRNLYPVAPLSDAS